MSAIDNASNPAELKKKEKQEEYLAKQEIDDIKHVLGSPGGRRFIWKYLSFAGVFQTSFTGNSQTFFNEGKRTVGLKLIDDITEANPDALTQMMKEARQLERTDNKE